MENMKKYVVICYAVHEEKIERYKTFDNKKDAYIFVKMKIHKIYINKKSHNSDDDWNAKIDFTCGDDGIAYLSVDDKEYIWTWEVIEIN